MARETRGWIVPYRARPVNHLHRGQLPRLIPACQPRMVRGQPHDRLELTEGSRVATVLSGGPGRRRQAPVRAVPARESAGLGQIPAVLAASRASPPTGNWDPLGGSISSACQVRLRKAIRIPDLRSLGGAFLCAPRETAEADCAVGYRAIGCACWPVNRRCTGLGPSGPALRPPTRYLGDSARRADYYCGNELPRWAALLRLARGPLWPARWQHDRRPSQLPASSARCGPLRD
jgi:hypothetical protein